MSLMNNGQLLNKINESEYKLQKACESKDYTNLALAISRARKTYIERVKKEKNKEWLNST